MTDDTKSEPGPDPERVKIKGDWKRAAAKALRKPPLQRNKKPKK